MARASISSLNIGRRSAQFIGLLLLLVVLTAIDSLTLQAVFVIGLALGAVLNYFVFGFTSAWRACILQRRTAAIRAQIWMLALAVLLFAPLILLGQIGEQSYQGIVRPAGLSVVLGAFLFGIGMQWAGACSSGTLNRVGQLLPLSWVSFVFLFVGGALGAYFYNHWSYWPSLAPLSFTQFAGGLGVLLSLALLALVYYAMLRLEQRQHGAVERLISANKKLSPWLWAALLLALLNALLFVISGQPWSVATVFTLWSLKVSDALSLGLDWPFWDIAIHYETRMARPILQDIVSLSTLGVMMGALLVTIFHRSSAQPAALSGHNLVWAILGGLLMGFGATLSYGCNIGAFFSGISSGSLHGWLWIVFAVLGNVVGLITLGRLKPLSRYSR